MSRVKVTWLYRRRKFLELFLAFFILLLPNFFICRPFLQSREKG
jgi:hypothetical protein